MEEYDPEPQPWTYLETRKTPNGVTCDIHWDEGLGGDLVPPEPPAQLDGGRITAGVGTNPPERMEIAFAGEQYSSDWRDPAAVDKPWPSWASLAPETLSFEIQGSASVAAVSQAVTLPVMPTILTPLYPQLDPEGDFTVAWQSGEADETLVILQFYDDWNDCRFRCYPPLGVTQLLIPATWLAEWPAELARMYVLSRNETTATSHGAQMTFRAERRPWQIVVFQAP